MPDQRPSEVLGALPHKRPQRRSTKRPLRSDEAAAPAPPKAAAKPAKPTAARSSARRAPARAKRNTQTLRQPPQPGGIPSQPRAPVPPDRPEILGTAVQAAAELAEIGLALSARALRRAMSRIPRP